MAFWDRLWKGSIPRLDDVEPTPGELQAAAVMLGEAAPKTSGVAELSPEIERRIDALAYAFAKGVTPGELIAPSRSGRPHHVAGELTLKRAVKDGFAANVWVWACARLIVECLKQVPWIMQETSDGANWRPFKGASPALDLWNYPNEHYHPGLMLELLAYQMMFTGNAGISKTRANNGIVAELWNIDPDRFRMIPDKSKLYCAGVQFYSENGTKVRKDPASEFMHFMFTNPADPFRGFGPLAPGSRTVDIDRKAQDWNNSALDNRASPSGGLMFDHEIDMEQYITAKKMLRDQVLGAENAGLPLIMGNAAKWVSFAATAKELDWIDGRKLNAVEVCTTFSVPPVMVGILEHATYSNFDAAERVLWRNAVGPFAIGVANHLNVGLVPEFHDSRRVRIWPHLESIAAYRKLTKEQAEVAASFFAMGWPRNAINRRLDLGFEEDPLGDVSFVAGEPAELLLADPLLASKRAPQMPPAPTPAVLPKTGAAHLETLNRLDAAVTTLAEVAPNVFKRYYDDDDDKAA